MSGSSAHRDGLIVVDTVLIEDSTDQLAGGDITGQSRRNELEVLGQGISGRVSRGEKRGLFDLRECQSHGSLSPRFGSPLGYGRYLFGRGVPAYIGAFATKLGLLHAEWYELQPGLWMLLNARDMIQQTILLEGK
jgi:hypothetical protein